MWVSSCFGFMVIPDHYPSGGVNLCCNTEKHTDVGVGRRGDGAIRRILFSEVQLYGMEMRGYS